MFTIRDGLAGAYVLLLLIGPLGNSMTLYTVFTRAEIRSRTNVYLALLALGDFVLLVYCAPLEIAQLYRWGSPVLCHQVDYLQQTVAMYSIFVLACVAWRTGQARRDPVAYMRQVCPLGALSQCLGSLAMLAVILIIAMPVLAIGVNMDSHPGYYAEHEPATLGCIRRLHIEHLDTGYLHASLLMVICVVPFICYLVYKNRILRGLANGLLDWCRTRAVGARARQQQGENNNNNNDDDQDLGQDQDDTIWQTRETAQRMAAWHRLVLDELKMISLVALVLGLCWAPLIAGNIVTALDVEHLPANYALCNQLFHLLAYTSSAVKPIIYARMSPDFGHYFKSFLGSESRPASSDQAEAAIAIETAL